MKKLTTLSLMLFLLFSYSQTEAKVFASGIKISDDTVAVYENATNTWDGNFVNGGVKIWFILNEAGGGANSVSAKVKIFNGNTQIKIIGLFNLTKGVNSAIWDGYDGNGAPVPVGNYRVEIGVNDAVGHTGFDSIWVAGARYSGTDLEGTTSFAYRGNASAMVQDNARFGNIYVLRGGSTGVNGIYELRADGVYQRKLGTTGNWIANTPVEASVVGNKIFAQSGYGYGAFVKSFDLSTDVMADSFAWPTISVRGFYTKVIGNDTLFYTGRAAAAGYTPAIFKKTGVNGAIDSIVLTPYMYTPTSQGYIKAIVVDDDGNYFVSFGEASASRKKIIKLTSAGALVYVDSLDGSVFRKPATAYFQSFALDRGYDLNSASDDKLYALIYQSSGVGSIYKINMAQSGGDSLISPAGISTGATSQQLNIDPAGNVVWSNGNSQERVVVFAPADGPNGYNTVAPSFLTINVTNPVPVELTSFNADVTGNTVQLSWRTATETNNSGFEVQRARQNSGNSLVFEKVAFVQGAGNSTVITNYSYTDKNLNAGVYIYRLKQIDLDGSVSYSGNVETEIGIAGSYELSQNYPNPFNPSTMINFSVPSASNVTLAVYNLNGELVTKLFEGFKEAGNHSVEFNAENLPSGIYIYRLSAGSVTLTRKMSLLK